MLDIDSLPIGVKPTNKMTFEDLIEEKLKIADQLDNEQLQLSKKRSSKKKISLTQIESEENSLQEADEENLEIELSQSEQAESDKEEVVLEQEPSSKSIKPRQFLKRGEGLKRYQPNTKKQTANTNKKPANNRKSVSTSSTTTTTTTSVSTATTKTQTKPSLKTNSSSNTKAPAKIESKPVQKNINSKNSTNTNSTNTVKPTETLVKKPVKQIEKPIEIPVKENLVEKAESEDEFDSNYFKQTKPIIVNNNQNTKSKPEIAHETDEYDDNELKEFETLEKYVEEHPSFQASYAETYLSQETKQKTANNMYNLDSSSKIAELLKELNLSEKITIENIYNNYRELDENDFDEFINKNKNKTNYSEQNENEDDFENQTLMENSLKYQNTSTTSSNKSLTRKIKRIQYTKRNGDEFEEDNNDSYFMNNFSTQNNNNNNSNKCSDYKSSNYKDDDFTNDEFEDADINEKYTNGFESEEDDHFVKPVETNKVKKVKFDDTSSWLDQTDKFPKDEWNERPCYEEDREPVVPSKLINKLFPSLKEQEEKQKQVLIQQQQQKDREMFDKIKQAQLNENKVNPTTSTNINASLLKEKITQLENEIEKFQKKNLEISKLKEKLETELKLAETNRKLLDKQKQDEFNRLKEIHDEEMRKLKQEKKIFEQYKLSIKDKPDRREREEIDRLTRQIVELNEELKSRETRWIANNNRLKERIEALEKEKLELKKELQLFEKQRIDSLIKMTSNAPVDNNRGKNQLTVNTNSIESISNNNYMYLKRTTSEKSLPISSPSSSSSSIGSTGSLALNSNHNQPVHNPNLPTQHFKASTNSTASPSLASNSFDSIKSDNRVASNKSLSPIQPNVKSVKFNLDQLKEVRNYSPVESNEPIYREEYVVSSITGSDRKLRVKEVKVIDGQQIDKLLEDDTLLTIFPNKTTREVSADKKKILVKFFNGDRKEINRDSGTEVYFYAETNIIQTTYANGLEMLKFPNGQIEKRHLDQTREIIFPDKVCRFVYPDETVETRLPNGTCIKIDKNGDKVIDYPNKQREIHTKDFKRREYPDGSVKTVYTNGLIETKYANGRIRLKDPSGRIISDSKP